MISVIVIAHGKMAAELINTAEIILGKKEHLYSIGIAGADAIDDLRKELEDLLKVLSSSREFRGALILTDMLGGSSCNICLPLIKEHAISVVSGVNLYMVISAVKNRDAMNIEDLKKKIMADASKSIADVCCIFKDSSDK